MPLEIEPPIFFWTQKEYQFLSNFYAHPFEWEGKTWKTVEHAFQAVKSEDEATQEDIRNAATPKEAKQLGRAVKLRADWEEMKYVFMRDMVLHKFRNEPLRSKLLATGNADIYEDSPFDKIWGTGIKGAPGPGKNWLGLILMEVRGKLRSETHPEAGKDTSQIPKGLYCYTLHKAGFDSKGVLSMDTTKCPYHDYVEEQGLKGSQNNGYCRYLERGDWDGFGLSLLWDQVKECGVNDDIDRENDPQFQPIPLPEFIDSLEAFSRLGTVLKVYPLLDVVFIYTLDGKIAHYVGIAGGQWKLFESGEMSSADAKIYAEEWASKLQ
jgi:ribA/ribD-fused uncharacterized protein